MVRTVWKGLTKTLETLTLRLNSRKSVYSLSNLCPKETLTQEKCEDNKVTDGLEKRWHDPESLKQNHSVDLLKAT